MIKINKQKRSTYKNDKMNSVETEEEFKKNEIKARPVPI